MADEQFNDLIANMVNNIQTQAIHLDLILSGGAFNAIYLVGCLYFFREMERRNKIIVHRISTCSASSFVALFYLTNNLELFETKVYNMIVRNFKQNKKYIFSDEDIITVFNLIETTLYDVNGLTEYEILKKVNYKLYITYFDIKTCKRVVKKKYRSLHDIFETIKKSAHIPFVTMNCMLYQNRYMDGWQPFIFTTNERKQLFVDLLGRDKIKDCIVLKNNKKNKDKILNGIYDAYSFFYQNGKYETAMCSYVGDYNVASLIKHYSLYVFSYVLCVFLYLYVFFFQIPSHNIMNIYFVRISLNSLRTHFIILLNIIVYNVLYKQKLI
jgi:hypothetical protein